MKPYTIHRLVGEAFVSNENNKPEINHIDGNKTNNHYTNLEWCTRSENCQHSFDIGLQQPKRGELNGMSKLTNGQVRDARKQKAEGGRFWGRNELAKKLGINPKHLQRIVNNPGVLWCNV